MNLSPRRPSALIGALVAVLVALTVPGTAASAGSERDGGAGSGQAIDTSSQASVAQAWESRMKPAYDVTAGWTGSVEGCQAGRPSAAAQDATLESLNFVRAMAGLDAVDLSTSLSTKAQQSALMMAANSALSHDPPESWNCWSDAGAQAAARSVLAWTSSEMTAGAAIEMYTDDAGSTNKAALHRRWLLNPFVAQVGSGLTSTTDAIYVMGPTKKQATNPSWVSWPTAGWFPSQLEPAGRWSLSSGSAKADFSRATVTVTRGKTKLAVQRFATQTGAAQPTLVFQVKGLATAGTYRVQVRNIKGAASTHRTYDVKLFTP